MFDEIKLKNMENADNSARKPEGKTLSGMNLHELLALRAEIDTYLPSQNLQDVNLEGELLTQYHQTRALLASIIQDELTPANQKAQVINTCSSILSEITRTQTSLYNAERLKVMEQAVINALKSAPTEVSDLFFANYERELATVK